MTDVQIAAVRAAADVGTMSVSLPVNGALVTQVKQAYPDAGSSDPAGFFVQAGPAGPALFVAVDAATLPTAAGDTIDFLVTGVTRIGQVRVATSITSYVRRSSGTPVTPLSQAVSSVDFSVAANLDGYESELVNLSGTVVADMVFAGNGFQSATIATAGTGDGGVMKLRLPNALADSEGLATGCGLQVTAVPMWRFNTQAQPSAFSSSSLAGSTCPAPRLLSAAATSLTSVRAVFDRPMNAATVTTGSMSIGGLGVTAVNGTGMVWTLTTATQTAGSPYTLTAATTAADVRGSLIQSGARTANFTGFVAPLSSIVINEIDYDNIGTDSAEFIELYNPSATTQTLVNRAVVLVNGAGGVTNGTFDLTSLGSLGPGEYLVIAQSNTLLSVPAAAKKVTAAGSSNMIENGPDAVILIDTGTSTVLDAVSYEGSITWTSVVPSVPAFEGAAGTSIADSNSVNNSMCRNPNGADTNQNTSDFILCTAPTIGAANVP